MKISLSANLKSLAKLFPVPLYAVGGCVRDALLGYSSKDFDIASSLTPDDVKLLLKDTDFRVSDGSKKLLTLVIRNGNECYEYTTFRIDSYLSGHCPTTVTPCADINVDATRRDFTVNAIYYDINAEKIVDPLGGLSDLNGKILRTTREAKHVFSEDGLRLMRLARFACSLGFTPTEETLTSAKNNAHLIDEISVERIRDELDKILIADTVYGVKNAHYHGLVLLDEIGVLQRFLPEITLGKGMLQRSDYHKYDVYEHILHTVKFAHPSVRLSALMHDVGKPQMKIKTGLYRLHDQEGEILTRQILERLRYPKSVIEETALLVKYHMYNLNGDAKKSTIRKFVQKNEKIIEKLVLLKYADYYGSGLFNDEKLPTADVLLDTLNKMKREKVPFSVSELAVSGNDLINITQLPEKRRGEVLNALLVSCATDASLIESKEKQLEFIKNYIRR